MGGEFRVIYILEFANLPNGPILDFCNPGLIKKDELHPVFQRGYRYLINEFN